MKELKINKNYLLLKNWWETIDLTNYEKSIFNKEIISLNQLIGFTLILFVGISQIIYDSKIKSI